MAANTELGWYGKLPTAGDFLQQRLSEPLIAGWSGWFTSGLMQWPQSHGNNSEIFARAPVWNFALPATLGTQQVQIGCLMPSRDRVGRDWPLLATLTVPVQRWHPAQLAVSGRWFQSLGAVLQQAVSLRQTREQLDRAIDALRPLPEMASIDSAAAAELRDRRTSLAWDEVSHRFDPLQYISYWWTNQSDGYPLTSHKHSGNLTATLFTQLFHPCAAAQAGRHGLYPPMFDRSD